MKQIVAIFVIFFASNASAVFWRSCHINIPTPQSVESPLCTDSDCTITRGHNLVGTVTFTPTAVHNNLELHVRYQAGPSLWIPVPVSDPNMCPHLTPACPTQPNVLKTLNLNVPIPADLPIASGIPFELFLTSMAPTISDVICWQQNVYVIDPYKEE